MTTFDGRLWELEIGVTGAAASVIIESISVLSTTSLQVNFKYPLLDNFVLRSVDSYSISPALTVHSVAPESVASPTYVVLTTDEQNNGTAYTLTLNIVGAA
jgi:hypothetical protein